ncbi:hypothetical protein PENTCL1PPCAC_12540 [Pristionchus entomophagus]|uniref:Uncharacterized protein n=1 Tax=Pristionchus entomophagus TaxID=358040 RepID=A0AAV5T4D3_9BILA|nr:hypothetical protein PENTCL1PPCAC_12540 [Pristionchus entomophagus]
MAEENKEEKMEEEKDGKKEVKKEEEGEMEVDDVDPSLADGNLDLLEEFEREIEERNEGGRREERSERELRELREMREDRGYGEEEEEEEQPVTPEPILFSQLASQPAIEIPEDLRRALAVKDEVKEEEDNESKKDGEEETKSQKSLSVADATSDVDADKDDNASDDGSDKVVEEKDDEIEEMERLREEMNNEMGGGEEKEDEEKEKRPVTPQGDEPASEFGLKSVVTVANEDAKDCETCNHLGTQHLYINQQLAADIEKHFSSPRLDWFDFIVDVKEKMPWIKEGKVLRPYRERDTPQIRKDVVDLFYNFYHELNDNNEISTLLSEINSSDAMEMYEVEWEDGNPRRPTIDLMIKMLHEFSVKCHSEDLNVPERVCSVLKQAITVILPSSVPGRHYWLTVLAGGSCGIKGRANQVVEEMARRCHTFFMKTFISGCFNHFIVDFVAYYCEVDLLCAQTPVVQYETKKKKEEESMGSQKMPRGKKGKIAKNSLENFPLVLLLVMEPDESPRRGLSESAILVIQRLIELVVSLKRHRAWYVASSLQRVLLCLLEAARWHCAQAANSALTGSERRRVKAVESASQNIGEKITVELQQNIQRVIRLSLKKGIPKKEMRDSLPLCWLEDIFDAME